MNEKKPRTAEEMTAREALCTACAQWDPKTPGCKLFRSCERKALTRSTWRVGHCPHPRERRW